MPVQRAPTDDRGNLQVIVVNLNGNNLTIQEALRTVDNMIRTRGTVNRDVQALPGKGKQRALPNAKEQEQPEEEPRLFVDPADVLPDTAGDTAPPAQGNTAGNDDNKPKRKPPTYQFVKDLNLRPEGKQSLRDFFAEKQPNDRQKQFTVILYYLTDVLGLSNVGANHIYHGFDDVGKKSPLDILQTGRLTAKRKGWVDSSDGNNLRMTTDGRNFVKFDLPEKDAAGSQE